MRALYPQRQRGTTRCRRPSLSPCSPRSLELRAQKILFGVSAVRKREEWEGAAALASLHVGNKKEAAPPLIER